jgi:hypothetical protein
MEKIFWIPTNQMTTRVKLGSRALFIPSFGWLMLRICAKPAVSKIKCIK